MKCARCDEIITKGEVAVKCYGPCGGEYHLDCTSMSVRTYRKKSEDQKRKWVCISCTEKPKKTIIPKVPSKENSDSSDEEDEEEGIMTKTNTSSIEKKLDLLLAGQNRTNKTIEKLEEMVKSLKEELKEKEKVIDELKDELHEFQQHYRNSYLEIHNLPEDNHETQEKLMDMVIKIAAEVGVRLMKEEIEASHRIQTRNKNKEKPVIVHLASRKKRNEIIAGQKKTKVTQDKILANGSSSRIFVNESLTKYYKELLFEAKKKAQEINFKYVWTAEGKILMRAEEKGRVFRIKNHLDLKNLSKIGEDFTRKNR